MKNGKKRTAYAAYKKGTEATSKEELISLINKSLVIFIKDQSVYDDNSQAISIEIHFKPHP